MGCFDDDRLLDPTPPAEAPGAGGWTAAPPQDSIFGDEPMLEVAREIPTFARFYHDENDPSRMVVALTDVADLGRPRAWQPNGGRLIGYEEDDPPHFQCGPNPKCRYADVALIEAVVPVDFEKIGRTTSSCGNEHCPEAVPVDRSLPTFRIVDRYDHVFENETVHTRSGAPPGGRMALWSRHVTTWSTATTTSRSAARIG